MKDQHKKINGYRDLSQEEIDLMNKAKALGEGVGSLIEGIRKSGFLVDDADAQRWLDAGQMDLQTGFMKVIRSVAKPTTF